MVSSPSLHSGHVSAGLLPAMIEVAMGYCCTTWKALIVAFALRPCHTGCNWLVEHASMLRKLRVAFSSACSCRCSVHALCTAYLQYKLAAATLNGIKPFTIANRGLYTSVQWWQPHTPEFVATATSLWCHMTPAAVNKAVC